MASTDPSKKRTRGSNNLEMINDNLILFAQDMTLEELYAARIRAVRELAMIHQIIRIKEEAAERAIESEPSNQRPTKVIRPSSSSQLF